MTGLLSLQIWTPFLGALLVLFTIKSSPSTARAIALVTAGVTLAISGFLLFRFNSQEFHFQFQERYPWIPSIGIHYQVGVDGIAVWLVALTSLMTVVALAMSRYVDKHVHSYMALILMLEAFLHGAFLSVDLILFFTFFELTLFPLYFLITVWGGENRKFAGTKFFIYTFGGSIFMLIGIVAIAYRVPGGPSFDLVSIQAAVADGAIWNGDKSIETLIFWSFAIGLLIKTPSFPFHTWIADTYAESPTAGPVLSSVMVKLGTFGLLRFCLPLFPDVVGAQVPILMGLAVTGILYGAVLAAVQTNFRRLIAYSSLSHMGFILLGIFSLTYSGMIGGAYQQINHGIVSGGLVLLLGFLWERRKSSKFESYGGLKAQMPIFAALFLILTLASVGLPGTNGFVGEFLSLLGTFEAGAAGLNGLSWIFPALAGFGVVLAAVYLLYMFQRLFYGPISDPINRRLRDLKPWEASIAAVLVAISIWGGLSPGTFLKPMEASVQATRLMATAPQGKRPLWSDQTQRIDVADNSPTRGSLLGPGDVVISPGDLHYRLPSLPPAQAVARIVTHK
jgi:NADH-quinone oxidoreductase subunit M